MVVLWKTLLGAWQDQLESGRKAFVNHISDKTVVPKILYLSIYISIIICICTYGVYNYISIDISIDVYVIIFQNPTNIYIHKIFFKNLTWERAKHISPKRI